MGAGLNAYQRTLAFGPTGTKCAPPLVCAPQGSEADAEVGRFLQAMLLRFLHAKPSLADYLCRTSFAVPIAFIYSKQSTARMVVTNI